MRLKSTAAALALAVGGLVACEREAPKREDAGEEGAMQPGEEQQGEMDRQRQMDQQRGMDQQGQMGQGQQQFATGVIRGTISDVDLSQGSINVRSSGGSLTLRARPDDIRNLSQGDVVSLQYANFGGQLWVQTQGGDLTDTYSQAGTVTGRISGIDRDQGTVTVRGSTFRAHPQQLQQVVPGQFVSLSYASVQGTNWISEIQARQEQRGGQQQGR